MERSWKRAGTAAARAWLVSAPVLALVAPGFFWLGKVERFAEAEFRRLPLPL